MLKKIIFSLSFAFFVPVLMAQNLSLRLESALNQKEPEAKMEIVVLFHSQPDFSILKQDMEQQQIPVNQRAGHLKKLLMAKAAGSQKDFLASLEELSRLFPGQISDIQSYWIANMILFSANAELIPVISGFKGTFTMDLNDIKIEFPDPSSEQTSSVFPKRIQKGVQVIKAPFMWNLGYTGRGRKAMGCDTGVNFTHPAVSSRFLGRHLPLSQCWFPYENPVPVDISSSTHGTHTMGTMLGINYNLGDTIGIAYNAYWIATDPIVSNLAEVKPVGWILSSFQWALDPDNNPETGNDVPDVINNSWGLANSGDPSHCNSYLNQIFEACEAAGIGVVFSAGNDGPEPGTTGEPANISINEVNIFSVGSVSGSSASFPVSGFSSRGPTNCVTDDSIPLWFKPEVVAPGENVWSAQGANSYGALSGTSMAAPHVAGAFLLLKEAFPGLTGTEILTALYHSATDLGNTGEDNVYGRGIINLEAAYTLLSQNHTPVVPMNTGYDIAVVGFSNFNNIVYETSTSFSVKVQNLGQNSIDQLSISISVNDNFASEYYWNGSINPGQIAIVDLPVVAVSDGKNKISVSASLLIDVAEDDWINNVGNAICFKPSAANFPYLEDFENAEMDFSGSAWFSVNVDSSYTWLTDTAGGSPFGVHSAMAPFYSYKPRLHQIDELYGPQLQLPDTGQVWLKFRMAYQRRSGSIYKDSLKIYAVSQNGCEKDLIYSAGCLDLATLPNESLSQRFVPGLPEHWRWDSVNISSLRGMQIGLMLEAKNDNGNQLFIDDISVYPLATGTQIPKAKNPEIQALVYPVPANENLWIEILNAQPVHILVSSITGQTLVNQKITSNSSLQMEVSNFQSGVYFLKITTRDGTIVKRFEKK